MSEQPAGEKTEEATPKRKQDARKKGTVAKSNDLVGALVLFALSLVLPGAASGIAQGFGSAFRGAGVAAARSADPLAYGTFALNSMAPILGGSAMLIFSVMVIGLVANFGQVGFHLSTEALQPKFSKLNPMEGFKRIFSARATMEGFKATAKCVLFGLVAYSAISAHWGALIGLSWLHPTKATIQVAQLAHTILNRIAITWLMIAVADYFFQRKQVDKQLKMTKDELRREMKEMEGSPELKGERMKRARKLSRGRMMSQVKKADVIITNPTHYAVAVMYERSKMHAPMVVAKGADAIALKIREEAKKHRVPIIENPPLARALYKQCEIGDFVPRDLFTAVAEVLAYVYKTIKGMG